MDLDFVCIREWMCNFKCSNIEHVPLDVLLAVEVGAVCGKSSSYMTYCY